MVFQIINRNYNLQHKREFKSHNIKTVSFGTESLTFLGPTIWDKLPIYLKSLNSLDKFKQNIENWVPQKCPCRLCKNYIHVGFIYQNKLETIYLYLTFKLQLA